MKILGLLIIVPDEFLLRYERCAPGVVALVLPYSCDLFPNSSEKIRKGSGKEYHLQGTLQGRLLGDKEYLNTPAFAKSNLSLVGTGACVSGC